MTDWCGKRVTVMGLGTRGGGSGVARYLAERGAQVTVTDLRGEDQLADQIADLANLNIRFVLGRHDDGDFTDVDVVVRNPAVRRWNPPLARAREAGVAIEMEMTIFLADSPAPAIGITGTKGKTSTSVLCGDMLRTWNPSTLVAGNMGVSAVTSLPSLTESTPVVLELSSWQLESMDERRIGPHIAVITNVSPDHLDTYADFDDYANTKRSITAHLNNDHIAIINADDPELRQIASQTRARVIRFGSGIDGEGVEVRVDRLVSTIAGRSGTITLPDNDALLGHHMRMNAAAAAAAALCRGADPGHIGEGLRHFRGIPNRMERVATVDGVLFVNDTAATAPAAALASITAFGSSPIHLIAGGADKKLDMHAMARLIAKTVKSVVLLDGTATPELTTLLRSANQGLALPVVQSMHEAVERATANATSGDIVLLSPGCASFGLFRDEFDRGQQFRECVHQLVESGAARS